VDFADFDNDGYPDLIVTDLANQKYAVYRNSRDGTFDYVSDRVGIGGMTLLHSGWGVRFLDYDNAGRKDLLIAQGHDLDTVEKTLPQLHYREPMLLARNTGAAFVDVSKASGDVFAERWAARGMAIGDIDNDGRIDAVVTTNNGPAHILHNETATTNHWLTIKLVGHKSNRDGIGAEIEVTTAHGAQWATVTSTGSYLSASDVRAHFGLGASPSAQAVEVHWPSGVVQVLKNVAGDRILLVDEPVPAPAH
jgi:enediyne biosynthesis protein E4